MTFYFYDLETSGINARAQRIMQFAGQRTDENFKPIGEPQNWLISLTPEILPDPEAVLLTGITPQKSHEEGYSEAQFLELFYHEVLQPDTVILGFNTVRFDDEFMRMTLWRNFYDAYEWHWQDGRSRWDLLDVTRMIRALRPDGINWPFEERSACEGDNGSLEASSQEKRRVPSNRLELLTRENGLDHTNAHDALSDVNATIAVARLLKQKQPKMFEYLLTMRAKQSVAELVRVGESTPIVYTSGRYSNDWLKTTAVVPIAPAQNGAILVYDLRVDPESLATLSDDELEIRAFRRSDNGTLPVKSLKPNTCPAVAPLGVLDEASQERIALPVSTIEQNLRALTKQEGLIHRLQTVYEKMTETRKQTYRSIPDADFQLYDGFISDKDKNMCRIIRSAGKENIADIIPEFNDERLAQLFVRYKARNYPRSLSADESRLWNEYRQARIENGTTGQLSIYEYLSRLGELSETKKTDHEQFLIQEMQLHAENLLS